MRYFRWAAITIFTTISLAAVPAHALNVGYPKKILIPTIKVGASIESLGVTSRGIMIAPHSAWTTGWSNKTVRPGQVGNSVMYGHLNTASSKAGVFMNLKSMMVGDILYVTDDRRVTRAFKVTKIATYATNAVPMNLVVGPTREAHLNLYTCAGVWNSRLGNYTKRLVVYTTLVPNSEVTR